MEPLPFHGIHKALRNLELWKVLRLEAELLAGFDIS